MYKKLLLSVSLFLLLIPKESMAQYRYNPGYWTSDIVLSSSSFLSDLGGKNANGTNDFTDLDLSRTRYAIGGGITYNIGLFSMQFHSIYTKLAADDALTVSSRTKRQLSVQTDVFEFSSRMNLSLPYRWKVIGDVYFGVGGGFIYYEPKTKYQGEWYKLRPLGTEGQNFLSGKSQYSAIAPIIPFAVGKRFVFHDGSSLSFELSMRKSFTDYLDDVSTSYADPAMIAEKGGNVAAILSDRSANGFEPGEQRGDPNNMDNYFLLGFKYSMPIGTAQNYNRSCTMSKPWSPSRSHSKSRSRSHSKGRAKFGRR